MLNQRFLCILCIMTVITSLVTVMPVSAEEVQGTETESMEVSTETEAESVAEEEVLEEEAARTDSEPDETEMTEAPDTSLLDETSTEEVENVTEPEQTGTGDLPTGTVSGNDAIPQSSGSVSDNDVASETVTNEAVTLTDTEQTYTDEQGNIFTYVLDEEGNATITGITVSGAALTIPDTISDAPVIAVANESSCVVTNPTVTISELTINCNTIGVKAFSGLSIGTLVIGEDVKAFSIVTDSNYSFKHYYLQFQNATIEKVSFQAVELNVAYATDSNTDDFYGPFYEAKVGALEIGSNVTLIPELLFHGATMELDTLELQVERIGAYAFASANISINHLIIGANVKCYEEFSNSSPTFHHWQQFAATKIGTLTFLANELDLEHEQENNGTGSLYPPFQGATIRSLEIGSGITRFPEMFLCNASVSIDELTITQNRVGAYAFSGAGISIGTLVLDNTDITFEESYYNTDLFHHFEQFSGTQVGTLKLYAPNLQLEKRLGKTTSSNVYAPFAEATVGTLEIGESVEAIPDYFLCNATMSMEELTINTPVIGSKAFGSPYISFGTLTIGEDVTTFPESYYSTEIFHRWNQFAGTNIGHLIYKATAAAVVNDVEGMLGSSPDFYGPFNGATIGTFTHTENVTCIPDYLLKDSIISMEELYLDMPTIGAMAFKGVNISIDKLTISENVETLKVSAGSGTTFQYWEQFAKTTIGEVHFNVPSLVLVDEAEHDNYCQGPFYESKIGKLYLSDAVERIPAYCFIGATLNQEELAIHAKTIGVRAFSGSNISIGTLTIGTEVETFESVLDGSLTYFRQFAYNSIGTLKYLPVNATTGTDCYKGIFDETKIGALELDEAVEVVPNFLLYNAIMELEEYTLEVPVIGYYSFSSKNIKFHKLTVAEGVTTFLANSSNYSRAFDNCTIEQLDYMATEARMEKLTSYPYGPFAYNTVNHGLTIGDNVKVIPYGCFWDADLNVEELTINNAAIGYAAFYGDDVKIGTLNIGKNVTYDGVLSNQLNTFQWATIGTLNYNSNAVDPEWSTASSSWGMFAYTTISELNIGEDVEAIPAFMFRNAKMKLESLTIPCAWSYYSFYGSDIIIGTLTLNGDVEEINHLNNQNLGFGMNEIETLVYEIPAATFNTTKANAYGAFYNAKITNFILGEQVEYIDYRMLRGNTITNCYVYPVRASEDYLAQAMTAGYLPTCTNLHIHYNSDFKPMFSNAVTEYHWLCVDYFDTTYGEKMFDEETGEYVVEIFKTCSVCGYEETGTEELDNSYDVYLSIPVEIPLAFDAETKSYTGSEQIYAYGTLGNAYEGIQLVVDREADTYGKAVMGENSYDISSYLTVGFGENKIAEFSVGQLSENASHVANGTLDSVYQEQMNVSVDALAFIESGVGEYQISIPLRFELK